MALVLECKDAQKVKATLAEVSDSVAEIIQKKLEEMRGAAPGAVPEENPPSGFKGAPPLGAGGDGADAPAATPTTGPAAQPPVKIVYKKDATKAGDTSVDAIVITVPDQAEHGKDLVKYIGDEQIRVLVAAPTDKMVIVTFGGAEDMMAQAIKTATAKSGDIASSKDVQAALDQLPKDRVAAMVFDLPNLMKLVAQFAPDKKDMPQFVSHIPAALGASVADATQEYVVFVPTEMIKEAIAEFQKAQARRMPPPTGDLTPGGEKPPKKPHEDF